MNILKMQSQVAAPQVINAEIHEDKIVLVAENRLKQLNEIKKSSLNGQLHIVEISERRARIMMNIANAWQRQANEMKASPQNIKHVEILGDSNAMGVLVADQFKHLSSIYEYYGCFDNNNMLQGIIILNPTLVPDELIVSYLVGNPENIRCPSNSKNGQISGAGTLLMDFAIERAAKLGKAKISLSPSPTSKAFYMERLGFSLVQDDDGEEFLEKSIV